MKSLGNFPDPFIREINGQPDALRRAAGDLAGQLPSLERLRLAAAATPRPVLVFTGMGSSYDACYPAVTELAAAGVPALHLDTAELLHFRRGLLGDGGILIAVSQSGRSAELIRLAQDLADARSTVRLVTVTNGRDNPLAGLGDVALDTVAGEEVGPSTMTFAGSLVVLAAVGSLLAGEAPAEVVRRLSGEAESAARAAERVLAKRSLPDELAAWLGSRDTIVLLARGPARAAAEMGALTLKEAVGLPAESLQAAQFRHGPLELAGPELAAIVIATEPETRDLDIALAEELVAAGAAVLLVTLGDRGSAAGAVRLSIGSVSRRLAPAVSILPSQLLAWRLAVLSGREPGAYVQASKVTTHE
jgi:glucosamine--fructose-6-phosphate aminotransferase (isomerizing)